MFFLFLVKNIKNNSYWSSTEDKVCNFKLKKKLSCKLKMDFHWQKFSVAAIYSG